MSVVIIPLLPLCAFAVWTGKTSGCLVKNFVAILDLKCRHIFQYYFSFCPILTGDRGSTMVKALFYRSEGR